MLVASLVAGKREERRGGYCPSGSRGFNAAAIGASCRRALSAPIAVVILLLPRPAPPAGIWDRAAELGKARGNLPPSWSPALRSAHAVCYRWTSGTTNTRWEDRKWRPGNPIPAS